jgi:hypothetical protein
MPAFPRQVPDSLVGIADPIIEVLGDLVPAADASRVRSALAGIDLLSVRSLGLEVVLPPHQPACDLSLLLPPREVPGFAAVGQEVLVSLAMSAGASDSTWWELDTSVPHCPVGAFVRSSEADALPLVRAAAAREPALARAVVNLEATMGDLWRGEGRLIGFFPEREPSPVAAALIPDFDRIAASTIRALSLRATAAVDTGGGLMVHLNEHLDGSSIAVAADAEGRTSVSWEASFWEREKAMAEGRWAPALQPDPVWGDAGSILPALLAVQGFHTFDSLPAIRLLSGIDHLKIGPDGRVKAYVGAHILMPGQR